MDDCSDPGQCHDKNLDAIRSRENFKKLIAEFEAKQQKE
jgi:hypothetical protein